jgi:chitinase
MATWRCTRSLCLAVLVLGFTAAQSAALSLRTPFLFGAFESWSDTLDASGQTQLGHVAPFVSVVGLVFMRPDADYRGGYDLSATGLSFSYPGRVLLDALAELRRRNPHVAILVSVGGGGTKGWDRLHTEDIRRFVRDFGLDGVDIDYEPGEPDCATRADGDVACKDDAELVAIVGALRRSLPRPLLLSIDVPHVAAYSPGRWPQEVPRGSRYTGSFRQKLSAAAVREALDFVSVMGYDAGRDYHPLIAAKATQEVFQGPVVLGVEPPPEYSGDHVYTLGEIDKIAAAARNGDIAGVLLYSLQKEKPPRADWPDSRAIAKRICVDLALGGCDQALY